MNNIDTISCTPTGNYPSLTNYGRTHSEIYSIDEAVEIFDTELIKEDTLFSQWWMRISHSNDSRVYSLFQQFGYAGDLSAKGGEIYAHLLRKKDYLLLNEFSSAMKNNFQADEGFIAAMDKCLKKHLADYLLTGINQSAEAKTVTVGKTSESENYITPVETINDEFEKFSVLWKSALGFYTIQYRDVLSEPYTDVKKMYEFIKDNKALTGPYHTLMEQEPDDEDRVVFLKYIFDTYHKTFLQPILPDADWNSVIHHFLSEQKIFTINNPDCLFDELMVAQYMRIHPELRDLYETIFIKRNEGQKVVPEDISFFLEKYAGKYSAWAQNYNQQKPSLLNFNRDTPSANSDNTYWQQCINIYYSDDSSSTSNENEVAGKNKSIKMDLLSDFSAVCHFLNKNKPDLLERIKESITACDPDYLSELIGYFDKTFSERFINIQQQNIRHLSFEESWEIVTTILRVENDSHSAEIEKHKLLLDGEHVDRFLRCYAQLDDFRRELMTARATNLIEFKEKIRYFISFYQDSYLNWAKRFDAEMKNSKHPRRADKPEEQQWQSMIHLYLSGIPYDKDGSQGVKKLFEPSILTLDNIDRYLREENNSRPLFDLIKKSLSDNETDYLAKLIDYFIQFHYARFTDWHKSAELPVQRR